MDETYPEFARFLEQNAERIKDELLIERKSVREQLLPYFEKIYKAWSPADRKFATVAATDSSEFVRELYNGKKIILARAYTLLNRDVDSELFADVLWVSRDDLRPFVSLIMEDCEHRSATRVIETRNPEAILIDGSLIGRLMHNKREIDSERHRKIAETYIQNLRDLMEISIEKGTALVFVSKSSESRSIMRKLLNDLKLNGESFPYSDPVLIRSLSKEPGYTTPLKFDLPSLYGDKIAVWSFQMMPSLRDLPMKVDFVVGGNGYSESFLGRILDTLFWGYSSLKVHNLWIAKVDDMVKFRSDMVESVYMRNFEKYVGVIFPETRGERRARIRI